MARAVRSGAQVTSCDRARDPVPRAPPRTRRWPCAASAASTTETSPRGTSSGRHGEAPRCDRQRMGGLTTPAGPAPPAPDLRDRECATQTRASLISGKTARSASWPMAMPRGARTTNRLRTTDRFAVAGCTWRIGACSSNCALARPCLRAPETASRPHQQGIPKRLRKRARAWLMAHSCAALCGDVQCECIQARSQLSFGAVFISNIALYKTTRSVITAKDACHHLPSKVRLGLHHARCRAGAAALPLHRPAHHGAGSGWQRPSGGCFPPTCCHAVVIALYGRLADVLWAAHAVGHRTVPSGFIGLRVRAKAEGWCWLALHRWLTHAASLFPAEQRGRFQTLLGDAYALPPCSARCWAVGWWTPGTGRSGSTPPGSGLGARTVPRSRTPAHRIDWWGAATLALAW